LRAAGKAFETRCEGIMGRNSSESSLQLLLHERCEKNISAGTMMTGW
jgi:hypothetical protein